MHNSPEKIIYLFTYKREKIDPFSTNNVYMITITNISRNKMLKGKFENNDLLHYNIKEN